MGWLHSSDYQGQKPGALRQAWGGAAQTSLSTSGAPHPSWQAGSLGGGVALRSVATWTNGGREGSLDHSVVIRDRLECG